MGLLSALTGSTFDPLVGKCLLLLLNLGTYDFDVFFLIIFFPADKATSEENTSEDWALIMDICDRVMVEATGPKECLRSIIRRLNSPIPIVVLQSLTVFFAKLSYL